MSFFEMRQYKVLPGKMDAWVTIMEEEIIPFQVSRGMAICGSYRGETDETAYFWIRRFESEEQRVEQYKAVYESEHWTKVIAPKLDELRDPTGRKVIRVVPTPRSPVQ